MGRRTRAFISAALGVTGWVLLYLLFMNYLVMSHWTVDATPILLLVFGLLFQVAALATLLSRPEEYEHPRYPDGRYPPEHGAALTKARLMSGPVNSRTINEPFRKP